MDPSWPVIADKALDKIPTDKVYEDLLQPSFQKAGEALATVIDFTNTMLFPFSWLNGRRALFLKDNLIRYQNKLNSVQEDVIEVPDIVSIPIIEKLAVTTNKELSEGFINLLAKASFAKTMPLVHPSFSNVLSNLSPDEARILFAIKPTSPYPALSIMVTHTLNDSVDNYQRMTALIPFRCGLELSVNLDIPQNIDLYMENLLRLRILEFTTGKTLTKSNVPIYDELRIKYDAQMKLEYKGSIVESIQYENGMMYVTDYGNTFIKACMQDIGLHI